MFEPDGGTRPKKGQLMMVLPKESDGTVCNDVHRPLFVDIISPS